MASCSLVIVSSFPMLVSLPDDDLFFQSDAVGVSDTLAHSINQRKHLCGGGVSGVDEKICVTVANARVADVKTLEAQLVKHTSSAYARRIFENTSRAFLI